MGRLQGKDNQRWGLHGIQTCVLGCVCVCVISELMILLQSARLKPLQGEMEAGTAQCRVCRKVWQTTDMVWQKPRPGVCPLGQAYMCIPCAAGEEAKAMKDQHVFCLVQVSLLALFGWPNDKDKGSDKDKDKDKGSEKDAGAMAK